MTKRQANPPTGRSSLAALFVGAGGAGAGFHAGRFVRSGTATAVARLAEVIAQQATFSTAAPIVASAVSAAGIVIASAIIPSVVVWTIIRRRTDAEKEKEDM